MRDDVFDLRLYCNLFALSYPSPVDGDATFRADVEHTSICPNLITVLLGFVLFAKNFVPVASHGEMMFLVHNHL